MTSTFLRNLSLDLLKLFENNDEYNVIIEIGEGSVKQLFRVHSIILCYRCPYLYNELKDIDYNDRNIKILETQLWNDIMSKYMAPNLPISSTILPARKPSSIQLPSRDVTPLRQVNISSKIITTEQAAKIISWIDGETSHGILEYSYEFNLILAYGASDASLVSNAVKFFDSFWNLCVNK
ncbi:6060_t:CDS:2, partial [Acaulospora morrowiae]